MVQEEATSGKTSLTSGDAFYDDGYTEEELNSSIVTKLDFEKSFFDRLAERKELARAYVDAMETSTSATAATTATTATTSNPVPAVLLWGISGTGKTHLFQQFVQDLQEDHGDSKNDEDDRKEGAKEGVSRMKPFPYIIQGKHDESTGRSDPFSAITQALDDYCTQVMQNGSSDDKRRLKMAILGGGSSDGRSPTGSSTGGLTSTANTASNTATTTALVKLVPSIRKLLMMSSSQSVVSGHRNDTDNDARSSSSSVADGSHASSWNTAGIDEIGMVDASNSTDQAWNQLQFAFVSFIKAVATKQRPIIMFLDDMQWSAQASVDLLTTLLSDKTLKNFLFVGAIREELDPFSNEVVELNLSSPLGIMFKSLQQLGDHNNHDDPSSSQTRNWTDLYLSNLSKMDIGLWLSQLMGRTVQDLEPITTKIYKQTEGNIFFTIQLVEQLERSDILSYSRISFQWEWHWPDEDQHFNSASNIMQLLFMKLNQFSPQLRTVLTIAAYIRFSFSQTTLQTILDSKTMQEQVPTDTFFVFSKETEQTLPELLDEAVLNGLLTNPTGANVYRFAHDRIQQAAYELIPYGETRSKFRQCVGKCLLQYCQEEDDAQSHHYVRDKTFMFVAADHLNSVPTKDHLFSVQLNLQVGELAMSMAALDQASTYFQVASNSIRKIRNPWTDHYDLTLQLCQARAEVELSADRFVVGYQLAQQVLDNAVNLDDKLRAYDAMSTALGRQSKTFESFEMSRKAARLLGKYPKRALFCHLLKDMASVKLYFRRHSDESFLSLPLMMNKRDIMAMNFLVEMNKRSFGCGCMIDFVVSILRMVLLSIQAGQAEETSMALVTYGLLMSSTGDQKTAVRLAKLSKKVVKKTRSKRSVALTHTTYALYVQAWSDPAWTFMEGFHQGYQTSMEIGNFENGFLAWACCVNHSYWEGYSLPSLSRSFQMLIDQMILYKVTFSLDWITEHALGPAYMMGNVALDWESMAAFGKDETSDKSKLLYLRNGYMIRVHTAVYFMKYEVAEELVERLGGFAAGNPAFNSITTSLLHPALACAGRYRQTRKKKYLQSLRQAEKQSKHLSKTKGLCNLNRSLLLKAELYSVTRKSKRNQDPATKVYNEAILASIRLGRNHEIALCCELAGEHCLRNGGTKQAIKIYFTQAHGYYQKWGAAAKAEELKSRRGQYIMNVGAAADAATSMFAQHVGCAGDGLPEPELTIDDYPLLYGNPGGGDSTSVESAFTKSTLTAHHSGTETQIDVEQIDEDDISILTNGSK